MKTQNLFTILLMFGCLAITSAQQQLEKCFSESIKNVEWRGEFEVYERNVTYGGYNRYRHYVVMEPYDCTAKIQLTFSETEKDWDGNPLVTNAKIVLSGAGLNAAIPQGGGQCLLTMEEFKLREDGTFKQSYLPYLSTSVGYALMIINGEFIITNEFNPFDANSNRLRFVLKPIKADANTTATPEQGKKKGLGGALKQLKSDLGSIGKDPLPEYAKSIYHYLARCNKDKDQVNAVLAERKAKQEREEAERREKERVANSLQGREVKSIELKVSRQNNLGLGSELTLGIVATLKDGTQLKTRGVEGGKTWWNEFDIKVVGGKVSGTSSVGDGGVVTISSDHSDIFDDEITIVATVKGKPTLKAEKTVVLDYSVGYLYEAQGHGGNSGERGEHGGQEKDCVKLSGGLSAGERGGDGQDGGDAPDVTIQLMPYKHKKTGASLIKAEMTSTNGDSHRWIFQPSNPISVTLVGGEGGSGGSGGKGQGAAATRGGNVTGAQAENCCKSLAGANGGDGGNGGRGGNGGNLTIIADSKLASYNAITFKSTGGGAGSGGSGGDHSGGTCGSHYYNKSQLKDGKRGVYGSKGVDGKMTRKTAAVQLSW